MIWRGTAEPLDRLYSALVYALPMSAAVSYGGSLFEQFPLLIYPFLPFVYLQRLLNFPVVPGLISIDFVAFICLYIFVVRNERIRHFIRFNVMQSILLGIVLVLIELLFQLLAPALRAIPSITLLAQVLSSTIFLGMTAACGYSVFQTVRGLYAEMPIVSEAAYYQIKY